MWVCTHECQVLVEAREVGCPLELELQATVNHMMWTLRSKLRSLKHLCSPHSPSPDLILFSVWNRVLPRLTWNSHYNPNRPWSYNPPASVSHQLRLQACVTGLSLWLLICSMRCALFPLKAFRAFLCLLDFNPLQEGDWCDAFASFELAR